MTGEPPPFPAGPSPEDASSPAADASDPNPDTGFDLNSLRASRASNVLFATPDPDVMGQTPPSSDALAVQARIPTPWPPPPGPDLSPPGLLPDEASTSEFRAIHPALLASSGDSDSTIEVQAVNEEPSSTDVFARLDLATTPPLDTPRLTLASERESPETDDEDEDGEDDAPTRPSWPIVALASYASAMTLVCLWLILNGWGRRQSDTADVPVNTTDASVAVTADRLTTLGQPIRSGDLEITPLEVKLAPVALRRTNEAGQEESRDGGTEALWLKVRLRNVGMAEFAPMQKAFLRDRIGGLPDTFIETSGGDRIPPYKPLTVDSPWSIVGQEFKPLKPGETMETWIVSVDQARGRAVDQLTWRIRFRTGPNPDRTEVLGVRFRDDEVRKGP